MSELKHKLTVSRTQVNFIILLMISNTFGWQDNDAMNVAIGLGFLFLVQELLINTYLALSTE